jgi:hypothetical protein
MEPPDAKKGESMKALLAILVVALLVCFTSEASAQAKNIAQVQKKVNEIDIDSLGTKFVRADSTQALKAILLRGVVPQTPASGFVLFVRSGGANTDTLYSISWKGVLKQLAP